MTVGSNVNPNYPIPGISQSGKGFRDNFSTIKQEIENLQGKTIQLTGDATSSATLIDSGSNSVVIGVTVAGKNTQVFTPNLKIIGNTATVIDTWSVTSYQSARYLIQVVNGGNVELNELLLTHNTTNAYINNRTVNSGSALGNITVDVFAGNVEVKYQGVSANNNVRIHTTYITI